MFKLKEQKHFGKTWGRSIKKKTISLWLNQPYPVYVVVYDEKDKNCYWVSIEEHHNSLVQKLRSSDKSTVYIKMDKSNVLKESKYDEFIRKIKTDTDSINFRLDLFRGTPRLIGEGYVRKRPIMYLPKQLIVNIRERIRISLNYLISHHLLTGNVKTAYFLCEFLTRFDSGHYDHFVLFGNICRHLGKLKEACSSYRQAISICKRDKNWDKRKQPSDPSIAEIIASIEKEMRTLNCESLLKR